MIILLSIRDCSVISAAVNYSTLALGAMSLKSCRDNATSSKSEAAIVKDRHRLSCVFRSANYNVADYSIC